MQAIRDRDGARADRDALLDIGKRPALELPHASLSRKGRLGAKRGHSPQGSGSNLMVGLPRQAVGAALGTALVALLLGAAEGLLIG